MKFFLIILIAINLFSFTLNVNNGVEKNNKYYIVHLQDDNEIFCKKTKINSLKSYICTVKGVLNNRIKDQNLPFMNLYFRPQKDNFNVIIIPKLKSTMLNLNSELYNETEVKLLKDNKSKHFAILMDSSLKKTNQTKGLYLPIIFSDLQRPSVGPLDFNKEPLTVSNNEDIKAYISLKKTYNERKYEDLYIDAKEALENFPKSIFTNEFIVFYLRGLSKITKSTHDFQLQEKRYKTIVKTAKKWMKSYPSDQNYPEILYMIMTAYLNLDQKSNVNYIIDVLLTEHKNSIFTQKAILKYAHYLFDNNKKDEAIRLYRDVLYSSKDIDLASKAAIELALIYFKVGKKDEALEYAKKAILANPKYLVRDFKSTKELCRNLKDLKQNELLAKIYKSLIENSKKKSIIYEYGLRQMALSPSNKDNVREIFNYIKQYQKTFPNSDYLLLIKKAEDELFFATKDLNASDLHKKYEKLIEKYPGNKIGKRAFYEDVELYYKEKNYYKILSLKDKIEDSNSSTLNPNKFLISSALTLANDAIFDKECTKAIKLINEFKLENKIKDKFKLFKCYIEKAHFDDAAKLAKKYIGTDNLHDRVEWMANLSKALFKQGEYTDCIIACDDAITLASQVKYSDPTNAIYYRFYSLIYLDRFKEALQSVKAMEELRGEDPKLIGAYDRIAIYASSHNYGSVALLYAKKTLNLAKRLGIQTYSPEINFIYIDELKKIGDNNEALEEAQNILNLSLNDNDLARTYYNIAELSMQNKDFAKAKEIVKKCLNIKSDNPWRNLCSQQNELLNR